MYDDYSYGYGAKSKGGMMSKKGKKKAAPMMKLKKAYGGPPRRLYDYDEHKLRNKVMSDVVYQPISRTGEYMETHYYSSKTVMASGKKDS